MDKKTIRLEMREKRKMISAEQSLEFGFKLLKNLLPILDKKHRIAIYHSCGGEISLKPTIDYLLKCEKKVYQPIAVNDNRLLRFEQLFSNVDLPIFVSKDYKIMNEIECYNLDFVIVPLIAVDINGNRLGQGGGYYDSTFAKNNINSNTQFCGVGYDWQLIKKLPVEDHDIRLNFFASEVQLLNFS